TDAAPGLEYRLYEGRWPCLPQFDALKPAVEGAAGGVDVRAVAPREGVGAVWRGLLGVETDGIYTFSLESPRPCNLFVPSAPFPPESRGACKLFVASAQVAMTTGVRPSRATGSVALRAGKHPFLLQFAQADGKPELRLRYSGPDFDARPLPEARLSHGPALPV